MLRIHFTAEDLARVRLAPAADPLWEMLLSAHTLGTGPAGGALGDWARWARPRLRADARLLFQLAPPRGYSADFLTPAGGSTRLEDGIETVLGTPRRRLRTDLAQLAGRPGSAEAVRLLAGGEASSLARLGSSLHGYFEATLAPIWRSVEDDVAADRAIRGRALLDGGVERLLRTIYPGARWESPVLLMPYPADRDLLLDGRGLLLVPSYFCQGLPISLLDPALPPVLVYPITHTAALPAGAGTRALDDLVGATRAGVLRCLATAGHGQSTTDLAQRLGASLPSVSEHMTVLRRAGLASTRREGRRSLHTITVLGRQMLRP
ncbi:DNA-binding transcriptional ArsR family regulator [Catenuloplanes nepalensis]|uniref:DNA-binding transcriptional ArsR family regulator n=1 Tax=Catenuloplanes nepalensis TaxID=587533 RepID=A0ABT9MTF9_9ACTN|nr:helix-turn-helix domain-containing protein [Catenuloplanes nepalensis]MDP9794674.1 DNA-binding transcriptional ArsR family regulator [Catenuloplanes nepalensis]